MLAPEATDRSEIGVRKSYVLYVLQINSYNHQELGETSKLQTRRTKRQKPTPCTIFPKKEEE